MGKIKWFYLTFIRQAHTLLKPLELSVRESLICVLRVGDSSCGFSQSF